MTGRWLPTSILVAIAAILFAFWYQYPQPTLDDDATAKMAATHVGNFDGFRVPAQPLSKTVIVVTGATSGIGLALASRLHRMGGTVLAIGRSPSKLERLRSALDGEGGGNDEASRRLIPFVADLNDLPSVSKAAREIKGRYRKIDFLVNNAGIHYGLGDFFRSSSTSQGYDMTFGTNYLSHFLLTEKLLPLLQKSNRNPRIVQVSSSFHWLSGGNDLLSEQGGAPYAAQASSSFFHALRSYPNSKLAQILHARALSRELKKSKWQIKVVSACPGWVGTPIGGWFNHIIMSHMAYPPDGFGLSSILHAMFESRSGVEGKDWVVNTKVFHEFGSAFVSLGWDANWTSETGFRDLIVWISATTTLYAQKFFGEVIWSKSSPESYEIALQDSLFEWSRDAVSDWL
mmetsp:Transcript_628/g.1921  ORF Transcript_628/g.1921 Transcript_628/m.1921 type:complete len:401 (-) Transcript_628:36-1238(-)